MVTFSTTPNLEGQQFQVRGSAAAFAGSRYADVPEKIARPVIHCLHALGFTFMTGCAAGVDKSFRRVLASPPYAQDSLIACAFDSRAHQFSTQELLAVTAVPAGLSPAAALHRRTVWMVRRSSLLVVFPENPNNGRWGLGSSLAFRAAVYNLKPVFVAGESPPSSSPLYRITAASLFGIVSGFWVLPHPVFEGGPCDEE